MSLWWSSASARTAPWPTSQLRICSPMVTRKRAMAPIVVNSRIPLLFLWHSSDGQCGTELDGKTS